MAEEAKKPESKGTRRYGHPRKIMGKEVKETKSSSDKEPAPKSTGSDGPSSKGDTKESTPGAAPKADVMAGTDGISVQKLQSDEREQMAARHAKAVHQLHAAHAKEHEEMIKRHNKHFGAITDAAAPDGGSPIAAGGL